MTIHLRLVSILFLFSSHNNILEVLAKQGEGFDLPPNSPLRIGVKKKNECKQKSKKGDYLLVDYVGKLYKNGKEFDSSKERESPLGFILGTRQVMEGWEKGLLGMCPGEIRKLVVPADYAYGEVGALPDIHENATLVFEIELLQLTPGEYLKDMDDYDDMWDVKEYEKYLEQMNKNKETGGDEKKPDDDYSSLL